VFPLIPLPIIEAINVIAKVEPEIVEIVKFPLIPLPIIEAMPKNLP